MASAMHRIAYDESLRAELIRRGLIRCRIFNWDDSARTLAALLKQGAENRGLL